MPEGDTIERIARRLEPLIGTGPAIATPHPRIAPMRLGERLAGRALQRIEARQALPALWDAGDERRGERRRAPQLLVPGLPAVTTP